MRMYITTTWAWNGRPTSAQLDQRKIGGECSAEEMGEVVREALENVAASTNEFRAADVVVSIRFVED